MDDLLNLVARTAVPPWRSALCETAAWPGLAWGLILSGLSNKEPGEGCASAPRQQGAEQGSLEG